MLITSPPVGEWSIAIVFVCLLLCLFAYICLSVSWHISETTCTASRNFVYVPSMRVAPPSSDGHAIKDARGKDELDPFSRFDTILRRMQQTDRPTQAHSSAGR